METTFFDPLVETMSHPALLNIQLRKLRMQLGPLLECNKFYGEKLRDAGIRSPEDVRTWDAFHKVPFTTHAELVEDQLRSPPFGTNLTYAMDAYKYAHHSARGSPRWLDTVESWSWIGQCWQSVYRAAGVTSADCLLIISSFGPDLSFWGAYEGARQFGTRNVAGGGLTVEQHLEMMSVYGATVVVCTPAYAMSLVEAARGKGIDLSAGTVRRVIHPHGDADGTQVPARSGGTIAEWGARTFHQVGSTEVGPWGFECTAQAGTHVNEGGFIAEVMDPATSKAADTGELVLTNLGRVGMPVIRYRTGVRVTRRTRSCACGRQFALLDAAASP